MPKSLWKGDISFGLVAIPVNIIAVEKTSALHFHLLDSRDQSRIHYHRVNEETGEEVPWDKIVLDRKFICSKKYDKNFVILSFDFCVNNQMN